MKLFSGDLPFIPGLNYVKPKNFRWRRVILQPHGQGQGMEDFARLVQRALPKCRPWCQRQRGQALLFVHPLG